MIGQAVLCEELQYKERHMKIVAIEMCSVFFCIVKLYIYVIISSTEY